MLIIPTGCNTTFNDDFFKGSQYSAGSLSLGFYAALWSYDGWLVECHIMFITYVYSKIQYNEYYSLLITLKD